MNSKYSAGDILVDKKTETSYFIFEVFVDELIYYNCITRNMYEYRFEEGILSSFWLDENQNIQKVGEDLQKAELLEMLCGDIKFMLNKQIKSFSIY